MYGYIILLALDYEVEYIAGNKHPSDCFSRFSSEWYNRNTESFDEEVLDSDTLYYSELGRDELITGLKIKFEEQLERYTAPQRRMVLATHQLLNTTPSTSRSIEYQKEDPYCIRIQEMLNKDDHLVKIYCKRFILKNDCLYKTVDSKHLLPRLILTPKM